MTDDDPVEELFRAVEDDIAPGVRGCLGREGNVVVVMWVRAVQEGNGDVGRWLDSIGPELRVRVIGVTSDRLRGMLERRGYKSRQTPTPRADGWIEAMVRL